MCGIAGLVSRDASIPGDKLRAQAAAMADSLALRGPNGGGVWIDPGAGVAFGHRRLAVVDLSSAGRQPMVSANGRYVITYNGEIFNHRELRCDLEAKGIRLVGESDTEVMLEAFSYWGIGPTIARLIGMFAIALWDKADRTLTLIRDRLGVKPLYYANLNRRFLFGSQLKALTAAGGWAPALNEAALASYLRFNYVPAPLSIFQQVAKLPPGCLLTLAQGKAAALTPYWDMRSVAMTGLAAAHNAKPNDDEAVEQLDMLLQDAVRHCMLADVPLGAFLSGGIDSSTVVALMQAQSTRPVKTFSIGFHEEGFDEAGHARRVADRLGCDHTELYIEPRHAIDIIPSLPDMFDEPFADPSQIPTHLVSRMARTDVTVALSGDGGDEVFAGYNHYLRGEMLWRRMSYVPYRLRRLGAGVGRHLLAERWRRFLAVVPNGSGPMSISDKIAKASEALSCRQPDDLYRRIVSKWRDPSALAICDREASSILSEPGIASDIPGFAERMQFFDSVTYLPDDILTKLDRASMHVGLEARVPLLDHRVVEFAWRQPLSRKFRDGNGKWLLRQTLNRYVPSELVDRPKTGFNVPIGRWLRGPLREWAESLLDPQQMAADGLLRPDSVARMWREHLSERRDWRHPLWVVLMFQQWRRNATRA
jgi:asparagine synthase (glutamine-hydrolysing)